ncbi:MAG: alpha-galactosidase [Clostridiales bacterium]|nr:alpha-galactosidase [Clostridiales bacterium]
MVFLIILIAVIAILIVLFISWMLNMKVNGKCPLCALKKFIKPTKITMNIEDESDYGNDVAQTPPMGWSSWNAFRNHIDQDLILQTAKAMRDSGLADAGYEYINLDDCWQSDLRDSDGKLQGDLQNFPRGIPELIKDINRLGLKVGLYSSNGTLTCEDLPASLGNEEIDAKTLAYWGCEFFKYDFCHNKRLSGNCPPIEKIIVSKSNGFEAELLPGHAKFTGRAKVVKVDKRPERKAIGFINHSAGTASFNLDVPVKDKYVFTIVYTKLLSTHNQYLQLIVNGKLYEIIFPTSKGFSDNGRAQVIVELNSGENKIVLQNPIVTLADSSYVQYKRMGDALKRATRQWAQINNIEEKPILFSICEWGTSHPWLWGAKSGNMWRTTHDIMPKWTSIITIYRRSIKMYRYSKPGAWNDPDMLEVGNGKLTENENKAHFSLWCMMAAPLMLGNDIRKFVDGGNHPVEGNTALKIVTNKQLIAIDQDTLGRSAKLIQKIGCVDIIARPLANGDIAVCALNRGGSNKSVHCEIDDIVQDKYLKMKKAGNYELHDLWTDERTKGNAISVTLPKHSVKVYRIKTV